MISCKIGLLINFVPTFQSVKNGLWNKYTQYEDVAIYVKAEFKELEKLLSINFIANLYSKIHNITAKILRSKVSMIASKIS